jgi:hypothetical protein
MRADRGLLAVFWAIRIDLLTLSHRSSFAMLRAAETFWEIFRICKTL